MALPDGEPARRPSNWELLYDLSLTFVYGAAGLALADGRGDVFFAISALVCGVGLLAYFMRDDRRYRAYVRSLEPDPPERPPWA